MKQNTLKALILKGAFIKFGTSDDNRKLGTMGSWGTLFGNIDWYLPNLDMWVRGTCGSSCCGACFDPDHPCKSACYVGKSYAHYTVKNEDGTVGDPVVNDCSVKRGHAYRTLAIRLYPEELLTKLTGQLTRRNKSKKHAGENMIVRINESGDVEKINNDKIHDVIQFWIMLATDCPFCKFYLYTKEFELIRAHITEIPENMIICVSVWHEIGINEYKEFSAISKQIKAFAVVDKEWTRERYAAAGVVIQAMCPAYNENGKMIHDKDHPHTCDVCGLCHNAHPAIKAIGCYEH